MPSRITASETVVVTGANGFIASHVVDQLLSAGYRVIGTVRSTLEAGDVQKAHGGHESLSTVVIEDITNTSAIITALEPRLQPGETLTAILHLAAPFSYSISDCERDLLLPAVKGTQAMLETAKHFQTRGLQRVIHTNSFACIYDANAGPSPSKTYTAADWSPLTYKDGLNAGTAPAAYRAAKAVAEKTAWAFMKKEQDLSFDLVSLCPAMVFGPYLDKAVPVSIKELNESNKIIWDVVGRSESAEVPPTKAPVWVDVRDVAKAHVEALNRPNVAGKRLLLAAGVYCNQEIADDARLILPEYQSRIPKGHPEERQADQHFKIDSKQEAQFLGMSWRTLKDSLIDLLPQLYALEACSAK